MPPPLTDEEIQEIRDLLAAASLGPWSVWNGYKLVGDGDGDYYGIERIGPRAEGGLLGSWSGPGLDLYATRADAEFVARAPEIIARLLDDLTEAQDDLDAHRYVLPRVWEEGFRAAWHELDRRHAEGDTTTPWYDADTPNPYEIKG